MKKIARIVMISLAALAVAVQGADRYVVPPGGSGTPTAPYTSWTTAATNLQDAAAATAAGDTVWVTNGTYYLGNAITVTNFAVKSFNNGVLDPASTIINGNNYAGKTVTNRCFTLSHSNALVEGFTITNGFTYGGAAVNAAANGGGVSMTAGTLRNCLVTGNTCSNAANGGGGVYAVNASSLITNCDIVANLAAYTAGLNVGHGIGGGGVKLATSAKLANSRILYNNSPFYWSAGGGVHAEGAASVVNCSIISNKIGVTYAQGGTTDHAWGGGGVWAYLANAVTLQNCLIAGNGVGGGGDRGSGVGSTGGGAVIENCTVVNNVGSGIGGSAGNGGNSTYRVANTISYFNGGVAMWAGSNTSSGVDGLLIASNCCMTSTINVDIGTGNTTLPPAFVNSASDFRLWPWSVGVDTGLTLPWMSTATDLAGNPRISLNGLPDIGAYETTAGSPPNQYVAQNGQTPVSPYTNGWDSAASNIQDAIGVTFDGAVILVTNGAYALTNQITVGNFTIRSYNNGAVDPDGTIIDGNNYAGKPVTNRCFSLGHVGSVVEGFTISNGVLAPSALNYLTGGAGVYMSAGTLKNCLVTRNYTTNCVGGGVYAIGTSCMITNCRIIANTTWYTDGGNVGRGGGGGLRLMDGAQVWNSLIASNQLPIYAGCGAGIHCSGVGGGILVANCRVIDNITAAGFSYGGVWMGTSGHTLRNCLITGNNDGANHHGAGVGTYDGYTTYIENCTVVNNAGRGIGPVNGGSGGCTYRIVNTISYYNSGDDMNAGPTGTIIASNSCVSVTNRISNFSAANNITAYPAFVQRAGGDYRQAVWSAGVDTGMVLPWMSTAADLDGNPRVSVNGLPDMGAYETTAGPVVTWYVDRNGQTPTSPYTNGWESAATSIAEAVSKVSDGATILVKSGSYPLDNQITVGNFTLRSDNNGAVDRAGTIIDGNNYAGKTVTNRCLVLNHANALVDGFTITNGLVNGDTGGGGVYLSAGTLRNCLVTGCMATNGSGGGVYATGASSLITNCDVIANAAKWNNTHNYGGGIKLTGAARVWNSRILYNSSPLYWTAGGGIHADGGAFVAYCSIVSNRVAPGYTSAAQNVDGVGGGGVFAAGANAVTLRNCLIMGNGIGCYDAGDMGGGVGAAGGASATIENCTVAANYGAGIGARSGSASGAVTYRVANTISYANTRVGMYPGTNTGVAGTLIASNCCAPSLVYVTTGSGNITNDPVFANAAAGNYRLKHVSPCLNTGTTLDWTVGAVDLDGNGRISPLIGGAVDMGAYEYQIQSGTSFTLR